MAYLRKTLDNYLDNLNLTRQKVANDSGEYVTTLQRASKKDVLSMNQKIFYAISITTGKTLPEIYSELLDLEMNTDITMEEFKLLINHIFKENNIHAEIGYEDLGYPVEAITTEIELPSGTTVSFGVHFIDKENYDEDTIFSPVYPDGSFILTKNDILQELADSMSSYDNFNEDDGLYYPAELESTVGTNRTYKTDHEMIGIGKQDNEFLTDLGKKLLLYV